jgi:hypothetical protein
MAWSLIGLLASGAAPVPSEQSLRANYTSLDPRGYETGYARIATSRFRQAWLVAREELSPYEPYYYRSSSGQRLELSEDGMQKPFAPSAAFLDAVERVIHCAPQLAAYRNELFAPERVRLANGDEIISFYLYRFRDARDEAPLWLSSFVLMDDGACATPSEGPTPVDLDYGGETLELWDVFEFRGQMSVLAQAYAYEAHGMRLFRRDTNGFSEVLGFWFAFLGE